MSAILYLVAGAPLMFAIDQQISIQSEYCLRNFSTDNEGLGAVR